MRWLVWSILFFALKGGDTKVRIYKNGNTIVTIRPAAEIGLATVF
jgi:hypothetical protein